MRRREGRKKGWTGIQRDSDGERGKKERGRERVGQARTDRERERETDVKTESARERDRDRTEKKKEKDRNRRSDNILGSESVAKGEMFHEKSFKIL